VNRLPVLNHCCPCDLSSQSLRSFAGAIVGPSGDPTMKSSQTSVEESHVVESAGSGQRAPGKKNTLSPVRMMNIDAADNNIRKKRLSGNRHTRDAENPSSGFKTKRAKEKVDGDKNESPVVSKVLAVTYQHKAAPISSIWKKQSHKGRRALEEGEGGDTHESAIESEICSSDKEEETGALPKAGESEVAGASISAAESEICSSEKVEETRVLLDIGESEDAPGSAKESEICSSDKEEETGALFEAGESEDAAENEACSSDKEEETGALLEVGESEDAPGSAAESEICSSDKEEETGALLEAGESENAPESAAESEICSSDKEEETGAHMEAGESEDAPRSAAESEVCSTDKDEGPDELLEAGESEDAPGSAAESEVCSSDEEEEISAFLGCSPVLQPVRQVGTGTVD
jgi:hypothetical protein